MELNLIISELSAGINKTRDMLEDLIEDYPIPAISILIKAQEYEIVGMNLYRLYEISNKDYYLMQYLIYKVPTELLIQICNKDSNIKLVQQYLDSYNI